MSAQDRPRLAAVMGWPVMHSRSPLMHGYWMEQLGLSGGYIPLAIEPGTLGPALKALHPLGFAGCNLTIPHKQDALAIVDEIDEVARRIGAISCVVVRPGGTLFGTNNDWLGFLGNLYEAQPDWRADSGPVTVIGGGGGARAIVHAMLSEGVPELRLVNRTQARARQIADTFGGPVTVLPWEDRHDALDGVTLAINTTSQGMVGMEPLDLRLDALPAGAIAADIIYTPLETPFLAAARARGNATVNGLGMLLHQGPPAWKLWFGLTPEVTPELRARLERSILGR
ncbi:shikimate dehydrogenase [Citreimonas sp.]|uniref:shikimate dehydrogenase n=1 Tax=Citreimonas sp. TaxID=3036715 RepID=UPI004057EA8C